jgi:MFS family permease
VTNRWAILALLFLVRSCMGFQFQSVPAVSPLFLKDFAVGIADVGVLIGIYQAPGVFLAIPGGWLSRRFGDTAVIAFGLALMVAGSVAMALSTSWFLQIASRLVAGTGAVLLNVLMSKMVADWFAKREMATAMGIFVNSWPFGIAAGLLLFPKIANQGGLLAVNLVVAATTALALIALATLYRVPPRTAVSPPAGVWPQARTRDAVVVAGLVWGFFNAALGVVFSFGPLMLVERGWGMASAGSTTSIVLWLVVVSVPLGGLIADRSQRPMLVLIASCLAFCAALVAAVRVESAVSAFIILGLVGGLAAGPIMSLPSRVLAPESRALGMGLFFTISYFVQAAGPSIAGRVSSYTGRASVAFDVGAVFLIVAIALMPLFLRIVANSAEPRPQRQLT